MNAVLDRQTLKSWLRHFSTNLFQISVRGTGIINVPLPSNTTMISDSVNLKLSLHSKDTFVCSFLTFFKLQKMVVYLLHGIFYFVQDNNSLKCLWLNGEIFTFASKEHRPVLLDI